MRSNALKKQEFFEEVVEMPAGKSLAKSWEARRLSIAIEAEAACHLSGNANCPDYEEFLSQGGKFKVSDFA